MIRRTMRWRAPAAACVAALLALPAAAWGEDRPERPKDHFVLGVGAFDINDEETAPQFSAEFRFNESFLYLHPHLGLFGTTDGSFYAYGGVNLPLNLTDFLVLTPTFSVGAYEQGDGKDLGGTAEFRSTVEIAYRFDDDSRLGIEFGHLSNAGLYDRNPGENFLSLNFAIPTGVFSR